MAPEVKYGMRVRYRVGHPAATHHLDVTGTYVRAMTTTRVIEPERVRAHTIDSWDAVLDANGVLHRVQGGGLLERLPAR